MGTPRSGDTDWFVRDRFGLFIHWGLYAVAGRHEWVKNHEEISDREYRKYFDHFDPDLYDPGAWAAAAKHAGMKYMVITAKHHEGFCLWDSAHTDYTAVNTPAGRDLLYPLVEAFRAEGLRVGFYYSLLDWHHEHYTVDRCHPMRNNQSEREKNKDRDIGIYAEYMRSQVRELLTRFGRIDLLWFDFSFPGEDGKGRKEWESEKLYALVRDLAPNVLIDNRLDLPNVGDFYTPEQYQPRSTITDNDGKPVVWEGCQTFSGSWGYYRDEHSWKNVKQLLTMLIDGVSKNGNLLLNVGPTARGEFDYRARERLQGIGQWMHYHARSIYGCGSAPREFVTPPDCRYTYNPEKNTLYLHILNWPFRLIHCPGLSGKVKFAQLLNDGSEIQVTENWTSISSEVAGTAREDEQVLSLKIPTNPPPAVIPVIEIFLK
jgi:alpha-L-fucosidase